MAFRLKSKSSDALEGVGPLLRSIPFIRDTPERALRKAEREVRWFSIPGGWKLFDVGEEAEDIYFVLSGSLGAFRETRTGGHELVGHIRAGEPVGEMAMIAAEPHERAVYALRDAEIISMSRAGFMQLVRSDPRIMERLTRVIMVRLRQARRRPARSSEPRVFGMLSTSPTIDLRLRAQTLAASLQRMGLRTAIVGEEAAGMPTNYFDELETRNDIVMLLANIGDTAWYKLVQRYADRLWLFARSDARPSTPLLPDDPSPARQFRLVDIVMLHHGGIRKAAESLEWKNAAGAARILHWRGLAQDDSERMARIMAGRSVGLVLSGGGARGFAHIGVVRALREARCPIDFIGGASMGAVIAACVACGWDDEEIDMRIRKAFVDSNPLSDYRLPVVALVKGKRVENRLQEHFADRLIEDLQTPFFAVSTNLTQGAYRIHTHGRLRDALRASISLPGILPPIVEDGQVLVDGAVLNNFPVDVMRDMHRGLVIGVDVAQARQGLTADEFKDPPGFLNWALRHGLSAPPPIADLLMRAATVSVDPIAHRALTDLLVLPPLESVELRDWKQYDKAVAAGYEAMSSALAEQSGPITSVMNLRVQDTIPAASAMTTGASND